MAYKDILVYLDPTAESVERLRFAIDLAKTHGARLVGVDVRHVGKPKGPRSPGRRSRARRVKPACRPYSSGPKIRAREPHSPTASIS